MCSDNACAFIADQTWVMLLCALLQQQPQLQQERLTWLLCQVLQLEEPRLIL